MKTNIFINSLPNGNKFVKQLEKVFSKKTEQYDIPIMLYPEIIRQKTDSKDEILKSEEKIYQYQINSLICKSSITNIISNGINGVDFWRKQLYGWNYSIDVNPTFRVSNDNNYLIYIQTNNSENINEEQFNGIQTAYYKHITNYMDYTDIIIIKEDQINENTFRIVVLDLIDRIKN